MLADRRDDRRYPLAYQAGGTHVIAAGGELDLAAVQEIERAATAGLEPSGGKIVIDLTAAAWIRNPELAALCPALRRLVRRGASVAVVGADPRTRDVLNASELEDLAFTSTVRDALALQPDARRPRAARRPSRASLPAARRRTRS